MGAIRYRTSWCLGRAILYMLLKTTRRYRVDRTGVRISIAIYRIMGSCNWKREYRRICLSEYYE
jgi:hypothetical protein